MSETPITPEQLAKQLADALPDQLRSVVLYGSAAAGDFVPGASNYNLLVVVESLTVAELDRLAPTIAAWIRAGNPQPLLFTPHQLSASRDAFPIELLDIRQSRRVLWGEDSLADMVVKPGDLRLQVERELTGKLLKLRARYLQAAGNSEAVAQLMLQSLSTFLVLFRAALRVYEDSAPERKLDALRGLAQHIEFDIRPFERLFELKELATHPPGAVVDVSFVDYLHAIECVAQAIKRTTFQQGESHVG
jgi:predicted nucleotidyltransferase